MKTITTCLQLSGLVLFLGLTACSNQNQPPTSAQAIGDCMADPVCPSAMRSATSSPYGSLTPIGTAAQGPTVAAAPAVVQPVNVASSQNPSSTSNLVKAASTADASNKNAYEKVDAINAAMSGGLGSGAQALQNDASGAPKASGQQIISSSQLGADPADSGAAGSR